MKEVENLVKVSMNYIWYLFRMYLNDPNYLVKNTDILASKFGNSEKDVKEFIGKLNKHLKKSLEKYPVIKYEENLTYQQLLNQITKYYDTAKI